MSFFAVEYRTISKIYPHPQADRLELGMVDGLAYQFCIEKHKFVVGDQVVYFPIDSILPDPLIDFLGIRNHLKGNAKNRVKTVSLRGEIGQGFVTSTSRILDYLQSFTLPAPEELTDALGVEKFIPEIRFLQDGKLIGLPPFMSAYDIESCDRHQKIVEELLDVPCAISEKAEGSNFAIAISPESHISVCQHNDAIENLEDKPENSFWQVARDSGFLILIEHIQKTRFPGLPVVLRGELVGPTVHGNWYRLEKRQVLFFDIEVNRRYLDTEKMIAVLNDCWEECLKDLGYPKPLLAPILSIDKTLREFLGDKTVQEASNGQSVLYPKRLREGIVIKPMIESYRIGFGRLFIKQRSPKYLALTDN